MAPNDQLNAQREQLITEKLVLGWTLLQEVNCPVCTTPLMVNQTVAETAPPNVKVATPTAFSEKIIEYQEILAQDSFVVKNAKNADGKHLVAPSSVYAANTEVAPNVPYCILCKSHVVMDVSDMDVLASMDLLSERNQKGSVIIHIQEEPTAAAAAASVREASLGQQEFGSTVFSESNSILAGGTAASASGSVGGAPSFSTDNVLPNGMVACANMGVSPLSTAVALNNNNDNNNNGDAPSLVQNTAEGQTTLPDIGTMPSNMGIETGIGNAQSTVAMSRDEGGDNGAGVTEEVIDEYNVRCVLFILN